MFRTQIREEIKKIVGENLVFSVERPESAGRRTEHGDYSSNVALLLAHCSTCSLVNILLLICLLLLIIKSYQTKKVGTYRVHFRGYSS